MSPASRSSGRPSMGRFLIALAIFWLAFAAVVLVVRHRAPFNPPPSAEMLSHVKVEGETLPVLWSVPAFSFASQNGKPVSNESLQGHVWIADFFYSQCTTVCPLLTARFVQLQREIRSPQARFVSFSVDPAHDSPEVLRRYAALWGDDARWQLLSTTPAELSALATGMRVKVAAGADSANTIIHSDVFLLVDEEGKVRRAYQSGSVEALARLVADVQRLSSSGEAPSLPASPPAPTAATAEARGEAIYQAMGCAGCHTRPTVAPPLDILMGARIPIAGGDSVTCDDAYLRESLLDPGRKLVAGYLNLMPSYAGQLDSAQIDDLLAYLKSRLFMSEMKGVAASGAAAADLVTDPVCHMQVRAIAEAIHADYKGKIYYFCCQMCRDNFVANPDRYLAASADRK